MDGTYNHNIKIPLMFTYGAEPYSICTVNEYNGEGPTVKTKALICFKDLLESCAVMGSSGELIAHLMFHSNKYAHGKFDYTKRTFVGYKWTIISVREIYQSLALC